LYVSWTRAAVCRVFFCFKVFLAPGYACIFGVVCKLGEVPVPVLFVHKTAKRTQKKIKRNSLDLVKIEE
jgi:hypothetical protein